MGLFLCSQEMRTHFVILFVLVNYTLYTIDTTPTTGTCILCSNWE